LRKISETFFPAGGCENVAENLPPARAANSPPSRPLTVRKNSIENFAETAGGMAAVSGTPGGGRLAEGVQPGRKIFNTLIKKSAARIEDRLKIFLSGAPVCRRKGAWRSADGGAGNRRSALR